MDGFVKLGVDAQKKVDDLFKEMTKERIKVVLKAGGMMLPLGCLTAAVTILAKLQDTLFPTVVGLATWILLNITYIRPAEQEIGDYYGEKIKEVVEDERRSQAKEG